MANADELLDTLLELKADGYDLREMRLYSSAPGDILFWSGELDVDGCGDIRLWMD